MEDYGFGAKRVSFLISLIGLSGSLLLAFLHLSAYIPGYCIGIFGAILYFLLLNFQMRKGASLPKEQAEIYLQTSWIHRFCLVLAIVLPCLGHSEIRLLGLIGGLFIPYRFVLFCNLIRLIQYDYSHPVVKVAHFH